jgi:hypothetical protein
VLRTSLVVHNFGTRANGSFLTFLCLKEAAKRMPMTDRGNIESDNTAPRRSSPACARLPAEDPPPALCGAMIQQREGHGVQSWPQQFIRLVGSHRRTAPSVA